MCVWRVSEWREGDGQAEKEKGRKRGRGKIFKYMVYVTILV
jgi:hypothetical protein